MRSHVKAVFAMLGLLLSLAFGTAPAAAEPPVVTIDPSPIAGYINATASGTVDPRDHETAVAFEFAIDPEVEGWSVASVEPRLAPGSGPTPVSAPLPLLKPASVYQVRISAQNFVDPLVFSAEPNPTFTTKAMTPPSASIDPVTDFNATTAHFSGLVDPQAPEDDAAFEVNWHFECTPACPGLSGGIIAADAGGQVVEDDASGLEPNTSYEVTLVAENGATSATAGPVSFKTAQADPTVQTLHAGYVNGSSALLGGVIKPHNAPVTYRFEWGADTSYGNFAPAAPQALGFEDSSFHVVTAQISGLQEGQTYHYRLIATNTESAATGAGADRSFTAVAPTPPPPLDCANEALRIGLSAGLPDCRAYEMVSPLDKNGGDVDRDQVGFGGASTSGAAASGDAVAYPALTTFGEGAETSPWFPTMQSSRGADGWTTQQIAPPTDNAQGGALFPAVVYLSSDLSKSIAKTRAELAPGAENLGTAKGLYMPSAYSEPRYQLLNRPAFLLPPTTDPKNEFSFAAATGDMTHVVFNSIRQLLPGAPPDANQSAAVYEWTSDGQVRLVSTVTADRVFVGGHDSPDGGNTAKLPGDHAISEDGRRIFFTAAFGGDTDSGDLYVREDAAVTRKLGNGTFLGARAADGGIAFFSAGDGAVYRWDAEAPVGSELSTVVPEGGGFIGMAGLSEDARTFYFGASEALAPGALGGGTNLYVWREGLGIRFIGDLKSDSSEFTVARAGTYKTARVTADGDRLLISTPARLTAAENGGANQVYLYDASLDELRCISCPAPASADFAASGLFVTTPVQGPYRLPRNLSSDGRRAFFETAQSLLPRDTNGQVDVYEWTDSGLDFGGDLRLISSGKGSGPSKFIDASETGDDVFFTTGQQLVGFDGDHHVDAYDARVGGGFPLPAAAPDCGGEACQGAVSPPPSGMAPGSDRFNDAGNAPKGQRKGRHCGQGKVKRKGRCVKKGSKKPAKSVHGERRVSR